MVNLYLNFIASNVVYEERVEGLRLASRRV
jgi:hypothetical protein